jgi:hypothetical protein
MLKSSSAPAVETKKQDVVIIPKASNGRIRKTRTSANVCVDIIESGDYLSTPYVTGVISTTDTGMT